MFKTIISTSTIIIVIGLFTKGEAIKCFQCNSLIDAGCEELRSNDTNSRYLQECAMIDNFGRMKPFCRKTLFILLDEVKVKRVIRGCGYELFKTNESRCYEADSDFKFEVNCQCFHDACNSAGTSGLHQLLFALPILVGVLCFRRNSY